MREIVLTSIYNILVTAAMWIFLDSMYEEERNRRKFIILLIGEALIIGFTCILEMQAFFIVCLEILFGFLAYKEKIEKRIINVIFAFYIVGTLKMIIETSLFMIVDSRIDDQMIQVLIALFILGFVLCIRLFELYKKSIRFIRELSAGTVLLIVMSEVALGFLMSLAKILYPEVGIMMYFFIGTVLIVVIFNVLLMYFVVKETYKKEKLKTENEIKESVIFEQKTVYNLLAEKHEETKMFRHDIGNHLGTLNILLEKNEIEKAKEYLQRINEENSKLGTRKYYYGNEILDIILASLAKRADEKNIMLHVGGQMTVDEHNVYDIGCIFSNSVNNAIEACEKINSKGPIEVKANESKTLRVISVSNPATQEMYDNIQRKHTTKADEENHGLGIKNIERSVKRLGGKVTYEFANERIILIIEKEQNM